MTAYCAAPKKISGSAAGLISYYKELGLELSFDATVGYYGIGRDEIVFDVIGGEVANHLPGLDTGRGITRTQFEDIMFNGAWNGQQLVSGGYRGVCKRDALGNAIKEHNPETGKLEPIYEYETVVGNRGDEVVKKKMEYAFTAGYDCPVAMDKSHSELLIAHPWYAPRYRELQIEAIKAMMQVTAERHNKVVKKTVAAPSVVGARQTKTQGSATELAPVEGLLWFPVFGMSARPTPESTQRGYGADPHVATHILVSSVAYVGDGKFQKIDGRFLYETAEFRAQVLSTTLNKLLEDDGVPIRYANADHKGKLYSEVKGSNPEARAYFSTGSQHAWRELLNYEREHGHPPKTRREFEQIWARVKGVKTKDAKAADVFGNEEQAARWRQALVDEGIELTITDIGKPTERAPVDERLDTLFALLDSKVGVVLGATGHAPVFGSEVILPAAWRVAEGLGFSADQIEAAAGIYRDTRLVLVRDAVDPSARLYTTQTILDAEASIAEALETKAYKPRHAAPQSPVPEEVITKALRSQRYTLDPDQEAVVRAICSDARLVHVVGKAGAGKTSALKPAVEAMREAGAVDQVVVVAVARKRANETGAAVDADRGHSIESLKFAHERGWKPTKDTLVILDEAALANTFDMAELLDIIGPARLVTVGDSKQATAIGAAGWYADELAKRSPITLNNVYRHSDERDAEAFDMIRDGLAHEALADLADRGRIFAVDDPGELIKLTRQRVEGHLAEGRSIEEIAIVHQGANTSLDAYNRMVQAVRMDEGAIDAFETFTCSELTTRRRWTLHTGDRCIFNKGVYLRAGDPIFNGQQGTIVRMDGDGACRVRLDGDDRRAVIVRLERETDVQPIAPAYCMSTSKFQGGEVKVNIVIPGSPEIASLNSGYSQVTRGVDVTEILLDRETWSDNPTQALAQAWSNEVTKEQASNYLAMFDQDQDVDLDLTDEADLSDDYDFMTERDDAADEPRHMRHEYGFDEGYGLSM